MLIDDVCGLTSQSPTTSSNLHGISNHSQCFDVSPHHHAADVVVAGKCALFPIIVDCGKYWSIIYGTSRTPTVTDQCFVERLSHDDLEKYVLRSLCLSMFPRLSSILGLHHQQLKLQWIILQFRNNLVKTMSDVVD